MALTVPALDLSEFQGTVDAPALTAAGIRHAIVRCADPSRVPPEDPRYEGNVANLLACGVTCDAYVFVRTYKGSAVNEAERYTRWALRAEVGRLWLDCESGSDGQMTAANVARWLLDLVAELEDQGWRDRLGIYSNASYWNPRVGPAGDDLGRLPFWVATYPRSTPPPDDPHDWVTWVGSMRWPIPARPWLAAGYVGWQFASNGTVVDGHKVDCNLFDPDFLYPVTPAGPPPGVGTSFEEHDMVHSLVGSGTSDAFGWSHPTWDPGFGRPPIFVSASPNGAVPMRGQIGAHVEANTIVLDVPMVGVDGSVLGPFDIHVVLADVD